MQSAAVRRADTRAAKAAAEQYAAPYTRPPIPVREIVEREGVDVRFVTFKTLDRDVAGFTKFDERRIYVNSEDAFNRQTFTIAHEFGHWVLHRQYFLEHGDEYRILLRRPVGGPNADPLEREANTFAAHLLVPGGLLRPVRDVAGVSQLARMFAVSEQMMVNRLKKVSLNAMSHLTH